MSGEGEFAEGFQLREVERQAVRMAEAAQDTSLQSERLGLEEIQFDATRQICRLGKSGGYKLFKERILGGGDLGGFAQRLAQLRIVVALQGGQQLAADAIAEKLRTEIGCVLAKWLAEGAEKLLDLPAGDGEHGTDELRGRRKWFVIRGGFGGARRGSQLPEIETAVDSGEAAGSGSTQQAEEHGFGLIVAGVGGGHRVQAISGGGALEEGVASAAPGSFQREMQTGGELRDILGCDGGVEREPGGEPGDEVGIGLRIRTAQSVVEMEDDGHDAQCRGELGQSPQQSHGISAATYGYADALAGSDEAMLAQVALQRLEHRNMIAEADAGMGRAGGKRKYLEHLRWILEEGWGGARWDCQ